MTGIVKNRKVIIEQKLSSCFREKMNTVYSIIISTLKYEKMKPYFKTPLGSHGCRFRLKKDFGDIFAELESGCVLSFKVNTGKYGNSFVTYYLVLY